MRALDWANDVARRWWPLIVSVVGGVIVGAVIYIMWTVVDERSYFEAEKARDARQDRQMAQLIEGRDERLELALREVEALLRDHFAQHDANVAAKLNELLQRIAVLLDRPVPEAQPARQPRQQPTVRPAPAPTTTTSTSTTSTTVLIGNSEVCERRPDITPCREDR